MDLWYTLFIVGAACYFYLTGRIIRGLIRLRRNNPEFSNEKPSVSVVIAARNEEKEIGRTIEALVQQNYPTDMIDIIIVSDRSTDRTASIVTKQSEHHPNIRLIEQTDIDETLSPKKQALDRGIRSAKGEIIVTTDADCQPQAGWLTALIQHFTPKVGMVAGKAKFVIKSDAPYWQTLQSLDFDSQGYAAAGLIADDLPFSCTGASMAFRKTLFEEIKGYSGVDNLISGDDELLLAKAARTDWQIVNAATPAAVVPTRPPESIRELWMQRIRWGSKGMYYNNTRRIVLIGIFLFLMCLTVGPFILIFDSAYFWLWIDFTIVKILLDLTATVIGSRIYDDRFDLVDFCILELVHAPALVIFAIAGHFLRFEWKGQSYRSRGNEST